MNDDIQDKLALLLKSERTLLRLQMRKKVRQSILIVLAFFALLAAIGALNVALYIYLVTIMSPLYSALSLAGADILFALLLLLIASNLGLGEDEKSAYEIRDFARGQVQREIDDVKENIFNTRTLISNLLSFKRVLQVLTLFKKGKK